MPLRAIQRIPKNQKDGTHTPTSQRREGSEERGSPSLTRSHAPTLGQRYREGERERETLSHPDVKLIADFILKGSNSCSDLFPGVAFGNIFGCYNRAISSCFIRLMIH